MTQHGYRPVRQETLLSEASRPYQEAMHRIREYLMGNTRDPRSGAVLPRYGQFSLMASRIPVFVFDHPGIARRFPTAFTDGQLIFLNLAFLRDMLRDEQVGSGSNVIPVLMHEMLHMLLQHTRGRHQWQAPPETVNRAQDIVINGMLLDAFEDSIRFGRYFVGDGVNVPGGVGTSFTERERYRGMTELQVLKTLLEEGREASEDSGTRPQAGSGQEGAGGAAEAVGAEEGPASAQRMGDTSRESHEGIGPDGSPGGDLVDPLELRRILEGEGLQEVADKAGLPRTSDEAAAQEREMAARLAQDTFRARRLAEEARENGSQLPGSHITDWFGTRLDTLHEPRIYWRDGIEQAILGGDGETRYTDDLPGELFHVDPADMGMAEPVYDGAVVPHRPARASLVIVDTSGSVGIEVLRDFFSEVAGMVREVEEGGLSREVLVVSADTVVRGEMRRLQPGEFEELREEGMAGYGRGGTSLAHSLNMAVELAFREDWPVDSLVYFTDFCDRVPEVQELHPRLPERVVYVVPEGRAHEQGRRAARPYADVCEIAPGASVDLAHSRCGDGD